MKERLKYEKYNGSDNVITIDLHNDYTVIAISGLVTEDTYTTTLFLKENTVDNWMLCEKAEKLQFKCKPFALSSAILKKVATLNEKNFFDYYIKRYEYELKCFDEGSKILKGFGD